MTDRASPVGYVVFVVFASLFAWLYAMLNHLPMH
jgi:hypothetical protein